MYVKKNLYIDLVNTPSELHKFSTNVNVHFSKENDFEAKEILYVRWQVFIPFRKDAVSMHRKLNNHKNIYKGELIQRIFRASLWNLSGK